MNRNRIIEQGTAAAMNEKVLQLSLGISPDDRSDLIYRFGCDYIENYCPIEIWPQACQEILETKSFWKWWQNQWEKREIKFIMEWDLRFAEELVDVDKRIMLIQVYHFINNWAMIGVYPNRVVVDEYWAEVIEHVFKELHSRK
jgi:hypothetical protein